MNKEKTVEMQQKLEHRILHGLSCEWEIALWVLDPSYRERLARPMFSLGDLKDRWGHFSSEKREICLSRDLVLNHSWDAVQEVLKHEIAHQLAQELLGADGEPPHGPTSPTGSCIARTANVRYGASPRRIGLAANPEGEVKSPGCSWSVIAPPGRARRWREGHLIRFCLVAGNRRFHAANRLLTRPQPRPQGRGVSPRPIHARAPTVPPAAAADLYPHLGGGRLGFNKD